MPFIFREAVEIEILTFLLQKTQLLEFHVYALSILSLILPYLLSAFPKLWRRLVTAAG